MTLMKIRRFEGRANYYIDKLIMQSERNLQKVMKEDNFDANTGKIHFID